ncbi:hypothetical protein ACOMHN_033472 [Nucella lapillus]
MYRKDLRCLARVQTRNGKMVKKMGTHIHEPSFSRVEALRVVQQIREKAVTFKGRTPIREVIASCTANLPPDVVALLPNMSALRRTIQRDKLRAAKGLPLPVSNTSEWESYVNTNTNNSEQLDELEEDVKLTDFVEPPVESQSSQIHAASSDSSTTANLDLEVWKDDEEMQNTQGFERSHDIVQAVMEIHTSKMTTSGLWAYKEVSQKVDYVTTRESFTDTVLGHWTTAGHRVNQVTQLIQYESMEHMLQVQRDMEHSSGWREQCRCLEVGLVSSRSVLTVSAPHSELHCNFEPSDEGNTPPTPNGMAVYEMQILPEQTCPEVQGSEATLVGRFLPLYGPSKTEYRLLRYPNADAAFAAAYNSLQALPSGSERQLLLPLPTSVLH